MLNLAPLREGLGPEFQPFTIRLSDGRSFAVPYRDFIAVCRGVVSVIDDATSHTINPLHIVSLEETASQNGT